MNNKNNPFSYLAGLATGAVFFTAFYFAFLNFSYIKTLSLQDFKKRLPKTFVVYSGSMSPALPVGTLIAIKPEGNYAVGDVISFRRGKQVITHRVSGITKGEGAGAVSYQTKGDANNTTDNEPVLKNQILGEAFFALPYLGYLLSFLRTKTGFTIFVIVPAILIIFGEMLSIKTEVSLLISERKKKKNSGRKPTFSFRLFLLLFIAPFIGVGASNAYFSDDEGSSGNLMSAGTWGEEKEEKKTEAGSAPDGGIIINEIMWMGSTLSIADEWIELKNLTGNEINIDDWIIENAGEKSTPITLSGVVPANSYFLISNNSTGNSAVNDAIGADLVTTSLSLKNSSNGDLVLKDADGVIIDQAKGDDWPEGENQTGDNPIKRSMERNTDPGDGLLGENWHTCLDTSCNSPSYWDSEGSNYGTPKDSLLLP